MNLFFHAATKSAHFPKTEIIIALALTILVAFSSTQVMAYAPDSNTVADLMDHIEQQKTRLNLTEEQQQQIAPILENGRDQRLSILESYGFGQDSKPKLSFRKKISLAKEMKAVRENTERALSHYLSPGQMTEYKKIQAENRERMKEFMSSR